MGTPAALHVHRETALPIFQSTAPRGLHERPKKDGRPSIHVIACPGGSKVRHPAQTRAMLEARQASTGESPTTPYRSLAGVSFDLSERERLKAACAGTIFAAISLAAAVL